MSELFFEIHSEEMPCEMQYFGASIIFINVMNKLRDLFQKELKGNHFFTPKRIGFCILDIPSIIDIKALEIRGPQITAKNKAIIGFTKKFNLQNKSCLVVKNQYYYYVKNKKKKMY